MYKYKISCRKRSTYPYPKSNIFLPHSYLLSSKRSTYCLQDILLFTKNCMCTPHRPYFRPAKKFDRILRSHGTSLFQAPTSPPPFPRSPTHIFARLLLTRHPYYESLEHEANTGPFWLQYFLFVLKFERLGVEILTRSVLGGKGEERGKNIPNLLPPFLAPMEGLIRRLSKFSYRVNGTPKRANFQPAENSSVPKFWVLEGRGSDLPRLRVVPIVIQG